MDALLRATLGPEAPARFAVIAAGDAVPAKKPAPDIYRLALERLGLPPGRCIAVEDTVNGLRAAAGAGIPTVITTSLYGGTAGFEAALSVPSLDERAWRSTEPRTPHPRRRLEAVAELNAAGIRTSVLVAPLMPGINDAPEQLDALLRACAEAGAPYRSFFVCG